MDTQAVGSIPKRGLLRAAIGLLMMLFKKFDVWRCYVNGRISYRATPSTEWNGYKPPWAEAHLDTVHADSKREALKLALKAQRP